MSVKVSKNIFDEGVHVSKEHKNNNLPRFTGKN